MNIEQARFITNADGENNMIEVVIDGITMCVPINPDNRHYAEIMKQVEEGTLTIEEAE